MGYRIEIEADINDSPVPPEHLEAMLQQLLEESTDEPVSRILFHGVVRPRTDEIREQLQQ